MFARTLARAGAAVALLDINLEAAEETARDIREAGVRLLPTEWM